MTTHDHGAHADAHSAPLPEPPADYDPLWEDEFAGEPAWRDDGDPGYDPSYDPGDPGPDSGEDFPTFRRPRKAHNPSGIHAGGPGTVPPMIVVATLRSVLAAFHGRSAEELRGMVGQVRASAPVLDSLSDPLRDTYNGVLEVLEFETANLSRTAVIDFDDLPAASNHTDAVIAELAKMAEHAHDGTAARNPTTAFRALAEAVQAAQARNRYEAVIATIDTKATAEEKMAAHKAIVPPTTQGAVITTTGIRTAARLVEEYIASKETSSGLCYSSGFLTVDKAFTAAGEPLSFIRPGEQTVVAGPTGTGKSSLQYSLTRNAAQDEINWGYPDAPVLLAHTEEESWAKAKAMGLFPGQRWHHLAHKIVIENIGSSRTRLTESVYDLVISAMSQAQKTGRPIQDFLPRIGFLDYIQSVTEVGDANDVQSNIITAELILRGFQAFNPDEMAKFSGIDFRAYAGTAWPEGIEDHRMAWVVFAQLKKPADENSMFFKAGSRNVQLSDFTLEDTADTPGWTDASGSGWGWEVRENDFRIFRQNQIMGSAKILQNATNIILLHRSRPYNNPAKKLLGPDGRPHLEDVRARLILDKTRNGSQMLFVPMAFDIQPDGFRAQYYDLLGEQAVDMGLVTPDESYRQSGDPLLPDRPAPSPLSGVRY